MKHPLACIILFITVTFNQICLQMISELNHSCANKGRAHLLLRVQASGTDLNLNEILVSLSVFLSVFLSHMYYSLTPWPSAIGPTGEVSPVSTWSCNLSKNFCKTPTALQSGYCMCDIQYMWIQRHYPGSAPWANFPAEHHFINVVVDIIRLPLPWPHLSLLYHQERCASLAPYSIPCTPMSASPGSCRPDGLQVFRASFSTLFKRTV